MVFPFCSPARLDLRVRHFDQVVVSNRCGVRFHDEVGAECLCLSADRTVGPVRSLMDVDWVAMMDADLSVLLIEMCLRRP